MSLLLLFKPHEGEGPEPEPTATPLRTLLGVGLTLALMVGPLII